MNISAKFRAFLVSNRAVLLWAACALCLPFSSPAQQNKLSVSPPEQVTVKRGGAVTATLKVSVMPGFHVNSDKPKDEFLIPLKLTWSGGPLQTKSISYPKPEEIKVGADMLTVFTGTFDLKTEFEAPEQASAGMATMTGKLRYQACNSEMCFRPATAEVRLPVSIE
ncbi:MAG: protein-disulfide reductase DsbD domain-containing protein [Bryobacteraceae bacterium]